MGGVFLPGKSKIFVILRTPQSAFLPRSYHPHFFIFYFPFLLYMTNESFPIFAFIGLNIPYNMRDLICPVTIVES